MRLLVIISSVLVLSTLVTPTYADEFTQRIISKRTLTLGPNEYYVENITLPQDWDFNYTTLKIDAKVPYNKQFVYIIEDKDDAYYNGSTFVDKNGTILLGYGGSCDINRENKTSCVGLADLASIRLYRPGRPNSTWYPGDDLYTSKIAFINDYDENYTFSYVIRPSELEVGGPLSTSQSSPFLWLGMIALPILAVIKKVKIRHHT